MARKTNWTRITLIAAAVILTLAISPAKASAQNLELSGGWAHSTGDFGLDGFNLGAAWWVAPSISIAADYDGIYDVSRVGAFEFTNVGAISARSHMQDFLIGPRFYFGEKKVGKYYLRPFAEAQFGESHLKSTIQEGIQPSVTNSDTGFSWLLGGGVDYQLNSHWIARGNLDLLRTHLNEEGQSRLRFVLGLAYTFGGDVR